MEDEQKLKMAVIAGAAEALDFAEQNSQAEKSEIMQHISEKADKIIKRIDIEEF